jgi:hypothetical protein
MERTVDNVVILEQPKVDRFEKMALPVPSMGLNQMDMVRFEKQYKK